MESTLVSEFASPKSISILAYLVPPTQKNSIPVFFDIARLQLLQLNGSSSSNPYECYKVRANTVTVPLLFCFARTDSMQGVWRRVEHLLRISAGNRVYSNLNNQKAAGQYDRAYAQVPIPVDYFENSLFFDVEAENEETEKGETEKNETSEEERKENDAAEEQNEKEQEKTAENAKAEPNPQDETNQSNSEEPSKANETPKTKETPGSSEQTNAEPTDEENVETSVPPMKFPLLYATSLSEMSQPFFNLASMQRIPRESSPLLSLFSEVNTKADYRCVLLCTSLASTQIQSSFDFEGVKNKNDVNLALVKAVCLDPSLVCYSEESLEGDRRRRDDSMQLSLYDCIELKKTSSVLLTGSKYASLLTPHSL